MRFLVTAVKWVRAAGLPRDPNEPAKPKASPQDWESLGRDLGRAVRKFRDGGNPRRLNRSTAGRSELR